MLVAAMVLVASAIGGVGAVLSSRNVGRDRVDQELVIDAARFPPDAPRVGAQLQFAFETRSATCEDAESVASEEPPSAPSERPPERGRGGNSSDRRARFLPEFASAMQLIRPNGTAVAACETVPISDRDNEIATTGRGRQFRTVSIEGERFRILTQGYDELGAVQFARSLEITDDTLRSLIFRIAAFGAVGALLAGALGWLWAKRATEPVSQLGQAAERIARTRDLGERIEVGGDDEIAGLATSFNSMLASLDTSREQQQRLVQDASHELRTPLTSMRTNIELLQRHGSIDDDLRAQVLADINSELTELTELTAELVESATEVPTQVEATSPVDLVDVATECVERSSRRHHRGIELVIGEDPRTVVVGDTVLLARALTNLINNAMKFSDSDTEVTVEVRGTSVQVLDRGPGIDADDLPNVFDRFYRAATARSAPGSGLGLAIVKQIVEAHRGTVEAFNRPDGGLAIGFTLPDDAV